MMPQIETGGPAFPVVETHPIHGSRVDGGMTLRDYFAGQALSNSAICHSNQSPLERAEAAYRQADEMLKVSEE